MDYLSVNSRSLTALYHLEAKGFCDKIPLKPNRAGVESFSSLVDVPLENIFYVGDSEVDGETVINSQPVKGILVSWGFRPRSVLEKFEGKNIKIVNTVEELKNGIN